MSMNLTNYEITLCGNVGYMANGPPLLTPGPKADIFISPRMSSPSNQAHFQNSL